MSKLVRVYLCPPPSSVAKNVVRDHKVRFSLENLKTSLILKYNLRDLSYDVNNLESAPADFRYSNSAAGPEIREIWMRSQGMRVSW